MIALGLDIFLINLFVVQAFLHSGKEQLIELSNIFLTTNLNGNTIIVSDLHQHLRRIDVLLITFGHLSKKYLQLMDQLTRILQFLQEPLLFLVRRLRVDVLTSLDIDWCKWFLVVLKFEYCRYYLGYVIANLENRTEVACLVNVFDATRCVLLAQSFLRSKWLVRKGVWVGVLSIDGGHDGVVESLILIGDSSRYLTLIRHHARLKCLF